MKLDPLGYTREPVPCLFGNSRSGRAMRVADFICAGAQKSGTTWLYEQLRHHPQVFMQTKEINFFYRDLPVSWYAGQFAAASSAQQCGDMSPNYAAFDGLARRIHQVCPHARVFHMLRSPVARAFSQWKMARYLGNIPREVPFIQAFRENLQYMRRRGEYAPILDKYARHFPLGERLAVFWYDDVTRRPAGLLDDVLTFLGLDRSWQAPALGVVVGTTPESARMSADDAAEIAEYYEPFDRQLRSMLGLEMLPWEARTAAS